MKEWSRGREFENWARRQVNKRQIQFEDSMVTFSQLGFENVDGLSEAVLYRMSGNVKGKSKFFSSTDSKTIGRKFVPPVPIKYAFGFKASLEHNGKRIQKQFPTHIYSNPEKSAQLYIDAIRSGRISHDSRNGKQNEKVRSGKMSRADMGRLSVEKMYKLIERKLTEIYGDDC